EKLMSGKLLTIKVKDSDFTVADAVASYFFNSQIVSKGEDSMVLISPVESKENPKVKGFIDKRLMEHTLIREVHYCDLRQSMRGGGGPACLRLRVVLTAEELRSVNKGCLLDDTLFEKLTTWVKKHYRDKLTPEDLADPKLLNESRSALDELTQ